MVMATWRMSFESLNQLSATTHRRRQLHAASAESRHASIQHALQPVQFVAARCPRACGVWPTDGKVDGDAQLAIADNHDKQHTVNARDPFAL